MFHFSRDLPESRIDDFLAFVDAEVEKNLAVTLTPSNVKELIKPFFFKSPK